MIRCLQHRLWLCHPLGAPFPTPAEHPDLGRGYGRGEKGTPPQFPAAPMSVGPEEPGFFGAQRAWADACIEQALVVTDGLPAEVAS